MGVDTHYYLLDYESYCNSVVPALDRLAFGGNGDEARQMFDRAWRNLTNAASRWEFPWWPFHKPPLLPELYDESIAILEGRIPPAYQGMRGRGWDHLADEDFSVTDPQQVREHYLRDYVCGVIVEGLCMPWELDFPPTHKVTWCLGHDLYTHSSKFEDALCAGRDRHRAAPYEILFGDELMDKDLSDELAEDIARFVNQGSKLWEIEGYRNLYLLLRHAYREPRFRVLVSYY